MRSSLAALFCVLAGSAVVDGAGRPLEIVGPYALRRIRASGCPNHFTDPYGVGENPNAAYPMDVDVTIPAAPYFDNSTRHSLAMEAGAIGYTLSGVSIYSAYAGGADPPNR